MSAHAHPRRRAAPPGLLAVLVGALLLAPSLVVQAASSAEPPARLVVGFHDVPRDLHPGDRFEGAEVIRVDMGLRFAVVHATDAPAFTARAQARADVAYVEVDHWRKWIQVTPNDPSYGSMYGPQLVRAPEVWDTSFGTQDSSVCVVDTGVRYTHEEIAGARWLGGTDVVNNDGDPWDDQGHGTHVAATAAGAIHNGKGIAGMGNVGLYGVKVLNAAGEGYDTWVAEGIKWCADRGNTVVSLSLGAPTGSSTEQNAVNYAWNKGSLVVAAAGNDGPCTNCVNYPGAYPNAIAVTCVASSKSKCDFSSAGPEADLAAPGNAILSASYSGDSSYTTKSGTSMSTPHVSGVAALLWSYAPTLTNTELRALLETNAQDLGAAGADADFGRGLVDAKAAFDDILVHLPQTVVMEETFDDGAANDWQLTGLWRVSSSCAAAPSAPNYLGYHRAAACDYDNTLSRTSGVAMFSVDLTQAVTANLLFDTRWETESSEASVDVRKVEASVNGGAWITLRSWDSTSPNRLAWGGENLSLGPLLGGVARIRFSFDSVDGLSNAYDGWYLDNVRVAVATNAPPIARAGPDQTVSDADNDGMGVFPLDGRASSDRDGSIVSARWLGAGGVIVAEGLLATGELGIGTHAITLRVTDDEGGVGEDSLVVTVEANRPPVAKAGADQTLRDPDGDGAALATLDGRGSSDPDGLLSSFTWTEGAATHATSALASVPLAVGTHTLRLAVTDNGGATATDDVMVNVLANAAPTARAAASCAELTCSFIGTSSSDPDGPISAYEWSFGDGASATGATATHAYAAAGTYVATLTVRDEAGLAGTSSVSATAGASANIVAENFDDGVADGFTLSGLWKVSSRCRSANSAPNHLGYTQDATCNFSTGNTNSGNAVLPLDLTGVIGAKLRFVHVMAGESGSLYDQRLLQVSSNGGTSWTTLRQFTGTLSSWTLAEQDLGAYDGSQILLRFRFDSRDATSNAYLGWLIDDFELSGAILTMPTARAGADQTRVDADGTGAETITLDGTASRDPDGALVSYAWSEDGAPLGTGATLTLPFAIGAHTVTLTVEDDLGNIATDAVAITVLANRAPTARAGADQTLRDVDGSGDHPVTLDGSASADPDGALAAFAWRAGDTLLGTSAQLALNLPVGAHTLTLTVTDAGGATATDTVVVTILANEAPIAQAGADQRRADADGDGVETFTLTDAGSHDPDGALTQRRWLENGALLGTGSALTLPFAVGVHDVTLEVVDDGGATAQDALVVIVDANTPPAADARVVCEAQRCTFDARNSTDAEGAVTAFEWTFGDGTGANGSAAQHRYAARGNYSWALTLRDLAGATTSVGGLVQVAPEPPRAAPPGPPAFVHVRDAPDDMPAPFLDVESAWFEADVERVYVGLKMRDFADARAEHATYQVDFVPTWSVPDPRWGGALRVGDTLAKLRVVATWNASAGASPDAPRLELRAITGGGSTVTLGALAGSLDVDTDILWWVLPRSVLQEPPEGSILRDPVASATLAFRQTGLPLSDTTTPGSAFAIRYSPRSEARTEAATFTSGMDGYAKARDGTSSEIAWSPAHGKLLVLADHSDAANEVALRPLPVTLTPATSFDVSARWRMSQSGTNQAANFLYLTPAGGLRPETDRGVLRVEFTSRPQDTAVGRYLVSYYDASGVVRMTKSVDLPTSLEVTATLAYDAPTGELRATLADSSGAIRLSGVYVVGSNAGDAFSFQHVGVAAGANRGARETPLVGYLDDVLIHVEASQG